MKKALLMNLKYKSGMIHQQNHIQILHQISLLPTVHMINIILFLFDDTIRIKYGKTGVLKLSLISIPPQNWTFLNIKFLNTFTAP